MEFLLSLSTHALATSTRERVLERVLDCVRECKRDCACGCNCDYDCVNVSMSVR